MRVFAATSICSVFLTLNRLLPPADGILTGSAINCSLGSLASGASGVISVNYTAGAAGTTRLTATVDSESLGRPPPATSGVLSSITVIFKVPAVVAQLNLAEMRNHNPTSWAWSIPPGSVTMRRKWPPSLKHWTDSRSNPGLTLFLIFSRLIPIRQTAKQKLPSLRRAGRKAKCRGAKGEP